MAHGYEDIDTPLECLDLSHLGSPDGARPVGYDLAGVSDVRLPELTDMLFAAHSTRRQQQLPPLDFTGAEIH